MSDPLDLVDLSPSDYVFVSSGGQQVLVRASELLKRDEPRTRTTLGAHGDKITTDREAAHFLRQATMGPTIEEIAAVKAMGSRRAWLNQQIQRCFGYDGYSEWSAAGVPQAGWFGRVAVSLSPPIPGAFYAGGIGGAFLQRMLLTAFLRNAPVGGSSAALALPTFGGTLYAPHKSFLCKATWILSKFIVCSMPGGAWEESDRALQVMAWLALLGRYAFKNYADLLEEVTYHIAMSRMLTYYANQKRTGQSQPDENYAREIMQLFTLGLYELNIDGTYRLDSSGKRIPTYDNADIEALAPVFTGLTRWDQIDSFYTTDSAPNRVTAVAFDPAVEATDFLNSVTRGGVVYGVGVQPRLRHYLPLYETGAKVALGGRINIPPGTDPKVNIRMAIDALVAHPNCAPFVAMNLIKHAITSNPSPDYVERVARVFENNGQNVRGDMAAVWLAIYTDPEATSTIHTSPTHGRARDGFDMYGNLIRSFSRSATLTGGADDNQEYPYIEGVKNAGTVDKIVQDDNRVSNIGTWPAWAPSIFGHYPQDYAVSPAAEWGIVVPELGAAPSAVKMTTQSMWDTVVTSWEPRDTAGPRINKPADYATELGSSYTGTAAALVEQLNLLFCGGTLEADKVAEIVAAISGMPVSTAGEQQDRVAVAMQLITRCTEFWVQ